jgi:cyclohexanone monooxygenase
MRQGTASSTGVLPDHVSVLIVGSGFSGLGAAIRLDRAGRGDFLVIERAAEVGGTWRDNTYPGAACDVPSHLYSFSFAANPDWSRLYSPGSEIQEYLRRTAAQSGTLDRHAFNCELLAAHWDLDTAEWVVETSRGTVTATVLVTAFGGLSEPQIPDIPGIESFAGEFCHSAHWDHSYDFTGKRVAVIGTGASAIQLVPQIATVAAHLDVYQRTAPWIMTRGDRAYSPARRRMFRRVPGYRLVTRGLTYTGRDLNSLAFCYAPGLLKLASRMARRHLARQVADPLLRQRLTPDFVLGCKRVLLSDDYYPAIAGDTVDLVTEPISAVRRDGIVTADGAFHAVDAIISATGFHATDHPTADLITGADGRTLGEHWRLQGQQAYKGTTVAGFPNMFVIVGPNTGTGNTSMIYMIESQLNYLIDALRVMDRLGLATIDVHPGVMARFNAALQRRMRTTVWTTGGASWYLDAHGRNTTLWPRFGIAFRATTRRFDLDAYRITLRPNLIDATKQAHPERW